jgi:hypothetical protein
MSNNQVFRNSLSLDAIQYFKRHPHLLNSEFVSEIVKLLAGVRVVGNTSVYNPRTFLSPDLDVNSFVNETARYVYFILYDLVENRQTLTFPKERYCEMVFFMVFFEAAQEIYIFRECNLLEINPSTSYLLHAMFLAKSWINFEGAEEAKKDLDELFHYYCGLAGEPLYRNLSDFDEIVELSKT